MCTEYLKGVSWTMKYYFDMCPSWDWQYVYYHAPFISDLSMFFKQTKFNFEKTIFPKSQPLQPLVQLLAVIPPSCHKILPKEFGKIMICDSSPLMDLFPTEIYLDMLYKESFHKCVPLVPNISIKRLLNATKNSKLTNDEKERNKIIGNITANFTK
jgi:5'-3' exonuclease